MKHIRRSSGFVTFLFIFAICTSELFAGSSLVLFDEGHAQTAGNADWVIGGAFSEFADVFKAQGCTVKSVQKFTSDAIKDASILVLPEPNSVYSPDEEAAIVNFVNNGGGLYAISDHDRSDRNGDGVDSVGVLNRFLPKLGVQIEKRSFSEAPVSGKMINSPITAGVKAVATWGGTGVKPLSSSGIIHIFQSGKNGGAGYIVTNITGPKSGKIVVMGDSSPYDDGKGDPRDKLYNGFTNPKFNHDVLAKNSVKWLLEKSGDSPSSRLSRLMIDVRKTHESILRDPNESLSMFIESSENSIMKILDENRDLKAPFIEKTVSQSAFRKLKKDISSKESFDALHQ